MSFLTDFYPSRPTSVLVKSDANGWSSRMQMSGQVNAIAHLRIGLLQNGFSMSDPAMEQALEEIRGLETINYYLQNNGMSLRQVQRISMHRVRPSVEPSYCFPEMSLQRSSAFSLEFAAPQRIQACLKG